jgi:hypothetical protein
LGALAHDRLRQSEVGMSKRKHKDKGRLPPFVPLHISTMETPAWKALSMGARVLYAQIKRHHFVGAKNNNGKIYLSERTAQEEIGGGTRDSIRRWFRELQHYGFIVQTEGGCLGVDGKGKAPHWRLTELPTLTERETQDYLKWDGTPFPGNGNQAWRGRGQKPRKPIVTTAHEKQNPGPETTSRVDQKQRPPVDRKQRPLRGQSGPETTSISADQGGPQTTSISRKPLRAGGRALGNEDARIVTDWPRPNPDSFDADDQQVLRLLVALEGGRRR